MSMEDLNFNKKTGQIEMPLQTKTEEEEKRDIAFKYGIPKELFVLDKGVWYVSAPGGRLLEPEKYVELRDMEREDDQPYHHNSPIKHRGFGATKTEAGPAGLSDKAREDYLNK